jgi:hypothetical protein
MPRARHVIERSARHQAIARIFLKTSIEVERHVFVGLHVIDGVPTRELLGHVQSFHSLAISIMACCNPWLTTKQGER